MNPKIFFGELKRRNVYKVAVAYAVVGWLVIQVATQVFPFLEISPWAIRLVIFAIALGFPVAVIIAWAFELTPEGVKRTEVADAAQQHSRGSVWIAVVLIAATLSLGLFFLGRYTASRTMLRPSEAATTVPAKSIAVLGDIVHTLLVVGLCPGPLRQSAANRCGLNCITAPSSWGNQTGASRRAVSRGRLP